MIDRTARDRVSELLRSYMKEELTAFQLDAALSEIVSATQDATVKTIGQALWFHYDDCKDHKVVASKPEWDYFNRFLLILESDGEIETTETSWHWHPRQAIAAMLFLAFVMTAVRAGIGQHLIAYALPFGPASMALGWFNRRRRLKTTDMDEAARAPFSSVGNLLSCRRTVPGFTKVKLRSVAADRRIRDPVIEKLMWIPWTIAWYMFSPVVLFVQMLPERESETWVKTPAAHDVSDMPFEGRNPEQ